MLFLLLLLDPDLRPELPGCCREQEGSGAAAGQGVCSGEGVESRPGRPLHAGWGEAGRQSGGCLLGVLLLPGPKSQGFVWQGFPGHSVGLLLVDRLCPSVEAVWRLCWFLVEQQAGQVEGLGGRGGARKGGLATLVQSKNCGLLCATKLCATVTRTPLTVETL